MSGAFHLDHSFVCADAVVAVLKVEAQNCMGPVLEENVADRAVDDVVDGRHTALIGI